jgi:hypothetical protein
MKERKVGVFLLPVARNGQVKALAPLSAVPVFLLNNVLSYHCHYFLVARDILYMM